MNKIKTPSKKTITISGVEYDRLEHFLEIITEATQSNYNKKYIKIHIKEDIFSKKVLECDLPSEEATSHMCAKIRPFILQRDHYSKLTEILRSIIAKEDEKLSKKHEAVIRESEKYLDEITDSKNNAFNLFLYGRYAKADRKKRERIKQAPKIVEGGFHNLLNIVFGTLVNLASLYTWLKKEYTIKSRDNKKTEPTTFTIGI